MVKSDRLVGSFLSAAKADGLTDEERDELALLGETYTDRLQGNRLKQAYYDDRVSVKNIGKSIPADVKANVDTSVGWAAAAVNEMAARSILDGFTITGDDEYAEEFNRLMQDSGLDIEYMMAVPSELTHGCGFWTVGAGRDYEPEIVINYHDAMTAAATFDYRTGNIRMGMVVDDMMDLPHGDQIVTAVTLHSKDYVTMLDMVNGKWEVTERRRNDIGVPLMTHMAFRPTKVKPFGRSIISRPVRGITDSMKREILRMEVHSEHHASPQKYFLNLSPEMYDALMAQDTMGAYTSKMLLAERDIDGGNPILGMLQPTGVDDRIKIQDKLAKRMSAETKIPLFMLGVETAILTSSEALAAALSPLVTEVEALNKTNGKALKRVAKIAMAMKDGKAYNELSDVQNSVHVHWRDPAMPSIAQQADAMLKIASAPGAEFLTQTDFFWERAGATEEERLRLASDRRRYQALTTRDAILGANS